MESPVFTYQEAADYLKISTRQIERLSADGTIPRVKLGRATRFNREDLDDFRLRASRAAQAD